MGKIRVKTLGIEEAEEQQQKEVRKRKEAKKTAKVPGLKGGQRIAVVGPSEEELAKLENEKPATTETEQTETQKNKFSASARPSKPEGRSGMIVRKVSKTRVRSTRYQTIEKLVDLTKIYSLKEALALLPKLHLAKFDETVELHINTLDNKIRATATLPHGRGKKTRVAIADDKIIENVAKGKIDFDVLIAEPSIMPKLARVAKFLGPGGLMPNPKNGTITTNPKELAKKFEGGQTTFRTESKAPIIHLAVGKISFGENKLMDNIKAVFNAIKPENIKKVTLKSTMSPGIRIQLD